MRVQKIKTTKSGSIGPNFQKGVVSENLVLSNRCAFIGFRVERGIGFRVERGIGFSVDGV